MIRTNDRADSLHTHALRIPISTEIRLRRHQMKDSVAKLLSEPNVTGAGGVESKSNKKIFDFRSAEELFWNQNYRCIRRNSRKNESPSMDLVLNHNRRPVDVTRTNGPESTIERHSDDGKSSPCDWHSNEMTSAKHPYNAKFNRYSEISAVPKNTSLISRPEQLSHIRRHVPVKQQSEVAFRSQHVTPNPHPVKLPKNHHWLSTVLHEKSFYSSFHPDDTPSRSRRSMLKVKKVNSIECPITGRKLYEADHSRPSMPKLRKVNSDVCPLTGSNLFEADSSRPSMLKMKKMVV